MSTELSLDDFMRNRDRANVTVEVVVERQDSKWVPFIHQMSWCKQKDDNLADWARDSVSLLGVLGGLPGQEKMRVGDKWHFRVLMTLIAWVDYWGEGDQKVKIHACRCFKKYRRPK